MGIKYEWRTGVEIETAADGLAHAAAYLTGIALQMREHKMDKVLLTWAQRHWDAYDLITTAAASCAALMPAQIDAKKQGRPSKYEKAVKQSQKDAATKAAKKSKLPPKPAKQRGRPRKKKDE